MRLLGMLEIGGEIGCFEGGWERCIGEVGCELGLFLLADCFCWGEV